MSTIPTRSLRTGVEFSTLGFGGAPLGELFDPVSETQAQDTLQSAWDAGIRYYDTAPFYGYGKSEHRLGQFLRQQERKDFVLSTKVGRVLTATRDLDAFDKGVWVGGLPFDYRFDYSYDGIMRSWEDSLQRLGLNSIDVLLIHDLDSFFHTLARSIRAGHQRKPRRFHHFARLVLITQPRDTISLRPDKLKTRPVASFGKLRSLR